MNDAYGLNKRLELIQRCDRLDGNRALAAEIDRMVCLLETAGLLDEITDDGLADAIDRDDINIVQLGRQIQIPLHSSMDLELIERMNKVCSAEANLVNLIHKTVAKDLLRNSQAQIAAKSNPKNRDLSIADSLMLLKLAKENINKRTEDVFDRLGAVAEIDSARRSSKWWPVWMQATLEDFADVCDKPNNLEVAMLSRFFGREMSEVHDWFVLKRRENKEMHDMQQRIVMLTSANAQRRRARRYMQSHGWVQASQNKA